VVSVRAGVGVWCHCRVRSIAVVVSASLLLNVGCCIGSWLNLKVLLLLSEVSGETVLVKS